MPPYAEDKLYVEPAWWTRNPSVMGGQPAFSGITGTGIAMTQKASRLPFFSE